MDTNHSEKPKVNFFIPFLTAFLGSKVIFYVFSFEYSVFSDPFDIQKLLIDIGVFGVLYYIGIIVGRYFLKFKTSSSNKQLTSK
tara:strand:- start:51 stop:302 length:252 start_codon:yes stop_codon:yes gene_type:complete